MKEIEISFIFLSTRASHVIMLLRMLAVTLMLLASGIGVASARKPHHKNRHEYKNKEQAHFGRFKHGRGNCKEGPRGQYDGAQQRHGQQIVNRVCACVDGGR